MSLIRRLRALLGPTEELSDLARAEQLAVLLPPTTRYATVGQFTLLPDARVFIGDVPGRGRYQHEVGLVPRAAPESREAGLLVLADHRFVVVTKAGERWSVPAHQVTDLDGHRHSGFVVLTTGSTGLVASGQLPVEVPPGAPWRTMGSVSNIFGGWDREFAPYGVKVYW